MRNNYLLPLIFLLTLILCVILGIWSFLFYKIYTNRIEARANLIQIETEKDKDHSLSSVRSLVAVIKPKMEQLDETFVYSDDIAGFVESLELQAKVSHNSISISNINLDQGSSFRIKPLTAHIDINGSWSDVLTLIGRLERTPMSISINRVSLSKMGDVQQKKSSWRSSFDIKTFVIDRPQQ
jgi:hypothetical protein